MIIAVTKNKNYERTVDAEQYILTSDTHSEAEIFLTIFDVFSFVTPESFFGMIAPTL